MVFSSLSFTFLFLPIVLLVYYVGKNGSYRNDVLVVASIFFYSFGEPFNVCIMIGSIVINYLAALVIDRFKEKAVARILFISDIFLNILILYLYKYFDFSIDILNGILHIDIPGLGVVLPIGISFYTFQALSYIIDVYRGKVRAQENPLYVALYISFFPQLIAGPIVRYSTIEKQIECRECTLDKFAEGVRRFMLGFCKKVIFANNLSMVVQETFSLEVSQANPLFLWMGAICYSLQIYYDFSGYSDMAIGLGLMFGFSFEENFDYPYASGSITEFWRRWHISLGHWFRDYVYIPLGGNRVKKKRHIMNLFAVWFFTGLWHGANYTFLFWGLGYFVLLLIEKELIKPDEHKNLAFRVLWRIFTLICINFGWVIFNSSSLHEGIEYCFAMIGGYGNRFQIDGDILFNIREYGSFIVCGILFSVPLVKLVKKKMESTKLASLMILFEPVGYALTFLWAVSFLILGLHNPFIYFNF